MNTQIQITEHWNTAHDGCNSAASDASAYPTVFGAELAVNGEFYGLAYMHEQTTQRTNWSLAPYLDVSLADRGCSTTPARIWQGQAHATSSSCPDDWSHTTRLPSPRLTPFVFLPDTRTGIGNHLMAISFDVGEPSLSLTLADPVYYQVTVSADLDCPVATDDDPDPDAGQECHP